MVWDWRVSRAGPMLFICPSWSIPTEVFYSFSLSLLSVDRLVLCCWSLRTDWVYITLSALHCWPFLKVIEIVISKPQWTYRGSTLVYMFPYVLCYLVNLCNMYQLACITRAFSCIINPEAWNIFLWYRGMTCYMLMLHSDPTHNCRDSYVTKLIIQ